MTFIEVQPWAVEMLFCYKYTSHLVEKLNDMNG